MRLTELLIITVSSTLAGAVTVTTRCGEALIGQPSELTCKINGDIDFTINWYKSGTTISIIQCKPSGTCSTSASSLYSINNITNNLQTFTIRNVSEDDMNSTWTCVDGTSPTSAGFSRCTLTQKLSSSTTLSMILTSTSSSMILTSLIPNETAETTANCRTGSPCVGKPFNLTCDIKGTVVHGIIWLRDGKEIIKCKKSGNCESKDTNIYSTENVAGYKHQFTILDVSMDDLDKTWTCVDGTPDDENTIVGCNLKNLVEEANEAAVGCSLVGVAVLVIIDVIIYIGCKDILSTVKKIYIIYCVVDVVIVGVVDGVATYYIYLRTSNIGIIAGTCLGFVVVSTIIKIIIVKTKLFFKCSSSDSSNSNNFPLG